MRRMLGHRWAKRVAAGSAALVAVGGLVALGTTTADDEAGTLGMREERGVAASMSPKAGGASNTFAASGDDAATVAATDAAATGGGAAPVPSTLTDTAGGDGSKIVRHASVELEVRRDGLPSAFDRVATIAGAHGGFVAESSTSEGDDGGTASLVVRVPVDRFDVARRELRGLGEVRTESISGQDVSGQLVDHDARLRTLRAQEGALQELLSRARNVGEVVQVQGQLFAVRQQIEQLAAQKAHLEAQAAMATIGVSLFEPGASARPVRRDGLASSLSRAVDGAEAVVGGTIVAIGYLLPIGAGVALAALAVRVGRRRRPVVTPAS